MQYHQDNRKNRNIILTSSVALMIFASSVTDVHARGRRGNQEGEQQRPTTQERIEKTKNRLERLKNKRKEAREAQRGPKKEANGSWRQAERRPESKREAGRRFENRRDNERQERGQQSRWGRVKKQFGERRQENTPGGWQQAPYGRGRPENAGRKAWGHMGGAHPASMERKHKHKEASWEKVKLPKKMQKKFTKEINAQDRKIKITKTNKEQVSARLRSEESRRQQIKEEEKASKMQRKAKELRKHKRGNWNNIVLPKKLQNKYDKQLDIQDRKIQLEKAKKAQVSARLKGEESKKKQIKQQEKAEKLKREQKAMRKKKNKKK